MIYVAYDKETNRELCRDVSLTRIGKKLYVLRHDLSTVTISSEIDDEWIHVKEGYYEMKSLFHELSYEKDDDALEE